MTADELVRRDVFDDALNLKQYLLNAGFVDPTVIIKTIDIGDWRGGTTNLRLHINLEPELASVRRAAGRLFTQTIPAIAQKLSSTYPESDASFGEQVLQEVHSNSFEVYG